jgi:hypothetical protein
MVQHQVVVAEVVTVEIPEEVVEVVEAWVEAAEEKEE